MIIVHKAIRSDLKCDSMRKIIDIFTMSYKDDQVSPDYLVDISPEYACRFTDIVLANNTSKITSVYCRIRTIAPIITNGYFL